jgi:putative zinc finger/helix-turn-helix YgiT family protein
MNLKVRLKKTCFKGVDVEVESEAYVCPCCGIEVGTVFQASAAQRAISEEYRKKTGLLTGGEIKQLRQARGLSEKQLADLMNVCADSVRKWECGIVQDFTMDRLLRKILF